MRAIAAGAGVDPAAVFYFFGTRQGLFAAAIEIGPVRLVPYAERSVEV